MRTKAFLIVAALVSSLGAVFEVEADVILDDVTTDFGTA